MEQESWAGCSCYPVAVVLMGKRGGAFYVCDALPYEHLLRDHHGAAFVGVLEKSHVNLIYPGSIWGTHKRKKAMERKCSGHMAGAFFI